MRHFTFGILTGAAIALGASQASAADLGRPVYKAAPAVVAAYNWSGFYTGVMGGYLWGDVHSQTFDGSYESNGWFGGGTIGVNWQGAGSPWVWGVEADLAAAGTKHSESETLLGVTVTASREMDWFGTARLRVGYAWDRALLYATGGAAWAHNEYKLTATGLGLALGISSDNTHVGWTIGGSVELALVDNWTAKLEYLYLDLGSERYFPSIGGGFDADLTLHTVKLGLNYRWGGGKAPVMAKY